MCFDRPADADGRYSFQEPNESITVKIRLKTNSETDWTCHFLINNPFPCGNIVLLVCRQSDRQPSYFLS